MPKIIQFNSLGGPEVLEFKDIALSKELDLDEVLYSVKAFALNRSDWLLSAGYHYTIPELPSRIGSEASGIVKAVGKNVTKFQVGDKVTSIPFFTSKYLVHGEVAITPEKYLTHCPSNLNFIESCSIWMQYLTAYYPFVEIAKIRPGDFVLIGPASSSAGLGAIDIVKSRHVRKDSYLLPYSMFNYVDKDDSLFRGIDYISKKIIEGIFKPKIDKVFSFNNTIEAYKYLLEYDVMGKIVVEIDSK